MTPLLETRGVWQRFGARRQQRCLDFGRPRRDRCLIGPNGAGKSTLFNLIAACCLPTQGSILFDGEESLPCRRRALSARASRARFRSSKAFETMSVIDNVIVGALIRTTVMREARRRRSRCWNSRPLPPSHVLASELIPSEKLGRSRARARDRAEIVAAR